MGASPFCLPAAYRENLEPDYHDESGPGNPGDLVSQPDVYPRAMELAEELDLHSLLDVGCGRATKLAAIHEKHPDWVYGGVDFGPNIEGCRARYSWGHWLDHDLEQGFPPSIAPEVVIVADVLEHLRDPRPLLASIRQIRPRVTLLSTPERDFTYPNDSRFLWGPPANPSHVREWTAGEFARFLVQEGADFQATGSRWSLTRSDDQHEAENTLLVEVRDWAR